MKKIRTIIILLFIVIIIVILLLILTQKHKNSKEEFPYEDTGPQDIIKIDDSVKEEEYISSAYLINSLVKQSIDFVNNNNSEAINLVFKEYTDEGIYKLVNANFYIQELWSTKGSGFATYYVYGLSIIKNKLENVYFKLNLDFNNTTYNIEIIDEELFNKAKSGNVDKVTKNTIEQNAYNKYKLENVSTEDRVQLYLKDFAMKVQYNKTMSYDLLDEEYRNVKFNSLQNFEEYIVNNDIINKLNNIVINDVGQKYENNNMEFLVETEQGEAFIIKEIKALHYKILLDQYTINTAEYIEEYNNSEPKMKVANNLNKIIQMLNNKDYNSIYKLLDNDFKKNYFQTEEIFSKYAKEEFYENNYLKDINIIQSEKVFTCTCEIKSGFGVSARKKTIVFYMKLGENTDFTLSINMQ